MTTQGIPDDLRPAQELPLDVAGALRSITSRLITLEAAITDVVDALTALQDAVKERQA